MDINIRKFRSSVLMITAVLIISISNHSFSAPVASGQLVLINSLGSGMAQSSVSVTVNDNTGLCSTTSTLPYNGVIVIPWSAANVHSSTKCTNITSVAVTALKTADGFVKYDSTVNSTPPAVATAPTTYIAPTTPIINLALIITGSSSPAMTNSTTSWGSSLGVAPVFSSSDGSLITTGIMGGVGAIGIKASKLMLKHGVMPAGNTPYAVQ